MTFTTLELPLPTADPISTGIRATLFVGKLVGFDPVGAITSKIFGGGGSRGVPVSGRSIDEAPMSEFIKTLEGTATVARDLRKYRNTGSLHEANDRALSLLKFVEDQNRRLGFTEIADNMLTVINETGGRTPTSPQDQVVKTDTLYEAANLGNSYIEAFFGEVQSKISDNPVLSAQVDASLGVSFADLQSQILVEQTRFTANNQEPFIRSALDRLTTKHLKSTTGRRGGVKPSEINDWLATTNPSTRDFTPERTSGRHNKKPTGFYVRGSQQTSGRYAYKKKPYERISASEYSNRVESARSQYLDTTGIAGRREQLTDIMVNEGLPDIIDLDNIGWFYPSDPVEVSLPEAPTSPESTDIFSPLTDTPLPDAPDKIVHSTQVPLPLAPVQSQPIAPVQSATTPAQPTQPSNPQTKANWWQRFITAGQVAMTAKNVIEIPFLIAGGLNTLQQQRDILEGDTLFNLPPSEGDNITIGTGTPDDDRLNYTIQELAGDGVTFGSAAKKFGLPLIAFLIVGYILYKRKG